MNMIISEQRIAWTAFLKKQSFTGLIITSGILTEQEKDYLLLTKNNGWVLKEKLIKASWMGFVFNTL